MVEHEQVCDSGAQLVSDPRLRRSVGQEESGAYAWTVDCRCGAITGSDLHSPRGCVLKAEFLSGPSALAITLSPFLASVAFVVQAKSSATAMRCD